MIFILGFAPESFSETDLKTVEIFVQPPTGFTVDDDMKNNDGFLYMEYSSENTFG